jgi:hypothetical protein
MSGSSYAEKVDKVGEKRVPHLEQKLATVLSGLSQVTQSLSFLCNEPDDDDDDDDDENDKRSEEEFLDVTNIGESNIICSESDS